MLRTCSEPDMTNINLEEELDKSNLNNQHSEKINSNPKNLSSNDIINTINKKLSTGIIGTIRLAQSLEDILEKNKNNNINEQVI